MGRPVRYNVDLVRGDSKTLALTFTDENATPINITTWTIYYTVKMELGDADADALIHKTITTHTDPAAGQTDIVLNNSDTQNLPTETLWHDIQVKDGDGKINTIICGQLNILADVTRAY